MKRWLLIIACWAVAPIAFSEDDSTSGADLPIGQRKYVIDTENKFAPIEIKPVLAPSAKVYLKDPNLTDIGKLARPLGKKTVDTKSKFVTKKKSDPKAIVFKALNVTGQRSGPRVEFTREALAVGRSDEPLPSDFFEKVFEPISDDDF